MLDCPCHGSQFSIDGAVLNGPAIHTLEAVDVNDEAEAMLHCGLICATVILSPDSRWIQLQLSMC